MSAKVYCTNEDCQHGFGKPSFAEIIARKRECPACGQINNVGDDLGKALDEKFAEIAELLTARLPSAITDDELPGLWQVSDFSGGADDCDVAAGPIVPPPAPFVPGEAPRKTASQVNAENLDSIITALRATLTQNVVAAIGKTLAATMDVAVSNGADSRSMPDEYVEVAAWLSSVKPITAHESPQQRDVIVRMPNGRLFRCGCGCNVFRKLNPSNPNEYTCNACEETYEGD